MTFYYLSLHFCDFFKLVCDFIDAIFYDNPTTYKIKDQDNELIKGKFYKHELQLIVEPKTYRTEKVIRKKKEGDRIFSYVKWKGYPDKFNTYVF